MLEIRKPGIASCKDSQLAYNTIYQEQEIRLLKSFYTWIFNLLQVTSGKRLLDIACGVGDVVTEATHAGLAGYGIDVSESAIFLAHSLVTSGRFVVGDGEKLPYPDNTFDYVLNVGSLEHFFDPTTGVQEMSRVLKPEGKALLLLPNSFGLMWNVLSVWKSGDIAQDEQPIQRYGTRGSWTQLLEQNGLYVYRVIKYEQEVPHDLADLRWYLRHPKRLLNLLISPFIPINLGKALVFLCNKSQESR